jgi:adenine-specific DNA-methyltransferase
MFQNYSDIGTAEQQHQRMYFSAANAGKIDAIRNQIERWRQSGAVTAAEFYILLASLLEAVPSVSNTTGTYAAFLKFWESRSQKPLALTVPPLLTSSLNHRAFRGNANALITRIECDVLYLDPPYNSRQYAPNYHVLETVARWDAPAVYGESGLRPYREEKSEYCQNETASQAWEARPCRSQTRRKPLPSLGSRSS